MNYSKGSLMKFILLTMMFLFSASYTFSQATQDSSSVSKLHMSLDVKDTDLRDVIRMISKGYNLNILLDQ
ncbi:MAG: hypothetical protein ACOC36_03090, partial [Fibrobacterota bacterium]